MSELEKYLKGHHGFSSITLQNYENVMTPMILEEREMRATQMSVFDRLMMDRIIWIAGPIREITGQIVQAQLMFLDIFLPSK